jgi:hypothetical protein
MNCQVMILMITAFIERSLATGSTNSVETFRTHVFSNSLLHHVTLPSILNVFTRVTPFTAGRKTKEIWGSQGSGHGNHCLPVYDAVYVISEHTASDDWCIG